VREDLDGQDAQAELGTKADRSRYVKVRTLADVQRGEMIEQAGQVAGWT
jgi:hypothetical protein